MNKYEPVVPQAELMCDEAAVYDKSAETAQSLACFENVLAHFPQYPRALHAKGVLYHKLGKHEEAVDIIGNCLEMYPRYVDAINSLGNIYRHLYRYDEARACYEKILKISSTHFLAWFNLGEMFEKEHNNNAAVENYKKAIHYKKDFFPAYLGIIRIYKSESKLLEAEQLCKTVLKLDPDNTDALFMTGFIRDEQGDVREAIRVMEQLKMDGKIGMAANAALIYYLNLLPEVTQEQIYLETQEFGKRFANQFITPHVNSPLPDRKIRIGFVSGDLKLHPVTRHLKPLILNLNRDMFELYAYSNYSIHDEVTEELKSLFCYWRNIHEISDDKVVETIRLDTIDILFDLSGYTGFSRLMLFAQKPAPLQVSWIGYFNTTGFRTMDYLISDDVTVKPEEERWFTEKIIRMPHSRFCYDPRTDILPDVASLPALARKYVTFGAFCKVNKLNEAVVSVWSKILHTLPGSRILFKWPSYKDAATVKMVIKRFLRFGIDQSRLEFRTESGYVDLLLEYTRDIDIVLDTFPHSGGATSCDAFLMGVPVITLSGAIPISRQTHGFVKLLGLEHELVSYTEDDYVKKALALANDLTGLSEIRKELRSRLLSSSLCDGALFTRNFEKEMRSIWGGWCLGKSIESILSQTPIFANDVYNEGINLMNSGLHAEAVHYFRKVIELESRNDKAMNNLAICLWRISELEEAEAVLRRARKINRYNDDLCCNLSGVLILKDKRASLAYARKGLALNDRNIDLYINLALALMESVNLTEAQKVLEAVIEKFSPTSKIMAMLGNCHGAMGNVTQAESCHRKALELDNSNSDAHSNLLYTLNNSDHCTQQEIFAEALRWDSMHTMPLAEQAQVKSTRQGKKLRIGLVSADFRQHPGGMLLEPFLVNYDRSVLEIVCYFNHHKYDDMTTTIKNHADLWRDVFRCSHQELFELIRDDQIDILIDMNGHTDKNRLKVFSMKPVSVQASWLGYFNTTGLKTIDYFISDEFTTPKFMDSSFSEKIVRLPHSRFCYSPPKYSPLISLAPAEINKHITFGAFNNVAKLSDTTVRMWSDVLKCIPRSRLLLKWKSYRDKNVKEVIVSKFERFGVNRNRIMIRKDIHHAQMLADYSNVDIVLDTFPFNGGMTSIEALWMGVPIVTLAGTTPASRQTGSFLRLLGLEECIAYDEKGFCDTAVALATNLKRLTDIRGTLRQKMKQSPLMDGRLFALNMQNILLQMYHRSLEAK